MIWLGVWGFRVLGFLGLRVLGFEGLGLLGLRALGFEGLGLLGLGVWGLLQILKPRTCGFGFETEGGRSHEGCSGSGVGQVAKKRP